MEIKIQNNADFLYIEPAGRLDMLNSAEFEKEVLSEIPKNKICVIDLKSAPYVSSAGLRAVMAIAKKSDALGNKLFFCGLSGVVAEVFEIAGLSSALDIYKDLEEVKSHF